MRTLFAEYNPQCNSIDVYTSAGYLLSLIPYSFNQRFLFKITA